MTIRRVGVEEARTFWKDASQHIGGTPDQLPDEGIEYWACGGICVAFQQFGPGIWQADYGVKPKHWGNLDGAAAAVLRAFCSEKSPRTVFGRTEKSNRLAVSFAKRLGFVPVTEINGEIISELVLWELAQY